MPTVLFHKFESILYLLCLIDKQEVTTKMDMSVKVFYYTCTTYIKFNIQTFNYFSTKTENY